jgi:hypothetical protein
LGLGGWKVLEMDGVTLLSALSCAPLDGKFYLMFIVL